MRPNQQNNKNRSRGRNGGRKHVNPLSRNYESNGPDVRVRGNAAHVAEKYTQLARDAQSSGDSVMAENYLQHAEHYYRIVMAAQPQQVRQDNPSDNDDSESDESQTENRFNGSAERQSGNDGETRQPAEAGAPAAPAGTEAAPAAEATDTAEDEQPRKRRPRRRRASGNEAAGDSSGDAQPEAGDLPAFITAGAAE